MKIKMYPAKNGDSFLIAGEGSNVLIDGGYAKTFETEIRGDLESISGRGERLDLVIATHIDADHIGGLIAFLTANGPSAETAIVSVGEVWHNSLRSLTSKGSEPVGPADADLLSEIVRRGMPRQQGASTAEEISASQGSSLARLLHQGDYRWNDADGSQRVCSTTGTRRLGPSATVRVIGPDPRRLEMLRTWWEAELRKMGYTGSTGSGTVIDDTFEFMCAHSRPPVPPPKTISSGAANTLQAVHVPDTSITNGSSIVVLIEMSGRRVLFLGDAWAEDVLHAVNQLVPTGESLIVDAIKISHHGSLRNTSPELLETIDAPVYFISSDGSRHGHPDFEVLAAIVDRPAAFQRKLYLNYSSTASQRLERHVPKAGAAFSVHVGTSEWIELEAAGA